MSVKAITWPKTALVTGATGFVGSHLAQTLVRNGVQVRAAGRNFYTTGRIWHKDIQRFPYDLRDASRAAEAVSGVEWVFHSGALSSPWGRPRDFREINVEGTRHLARAAAKADVQRFVHVSSTSVYFSNKSRTDVTELDEFATEHSSHYAESKVHAESEIIDAVRTLGLAATIVRARAVIGPGDTTIVPRLLAAARSGRLRQVGDGKNRIDLTFVSNLVDGLILAARHGKVGDAYIITNDEPIEIWPLLKKLAENIGHPLKAGKVPYALARGVAKGVERIYETSNAVGLGERLGEPPLTDYSVGLLATDQTFVIDKAKQELGYAPKVSIADAIETTADHYAGKTRTDVQPAQVKFRLYYSAHVDAHAAMVLRGAKGNATFRCFAALVEHPTFGLTLFDTGYAPRLNKLMRQTKGVPYRLLAGVEVADEHSIATQMRMNGLDPLDVQRVILSHFHADHIAGLRDFPAADILAHQDAIRDIRRLKGVQAIRRAFFNELLPEDFDTRVSSITRFEDPGLGPFPFAHDLFGDGSVRLVPLPGHAAGHLGMLLNGPEDKKRFFVADACWLSDGFRQNRSSPAITRVLVDSKRDERSTIHSLHTLHTKYPDVEILPTHCAEVHEKYGDARWC